MILSLDISTKNVGWALFKGDSLHGSGVFSSKTKEPLLRIEDLRHQISASTLRFSDLDAVVYEEPAGGFATPLTGLRMGMAIGAIISVFPAKILKPMNPARWKAHFIGDHRVGKQTIVDAVNALYGTDITSNDEADAVAMGRCWLELEELEV